MRQPISSDRPLVRLSPSLYLAIGGTIVLVAVALAVPALGPGWLRRWFLAAGSLGFVTVGWLAGGWETRYGRWLMGGLLFCLAGDILGPYHFAAGALMFLLAHLLFVVAFRVYGRHSAAWYFSLSMIVVSCLLLAWLVPRVDRGLLWLVLLYTLVITVMAITAAGTNRLILSAALIFYVSDIFVARWRFVDPDPFNAFLCYPLYYTACLLFAVSIATVPPTSNVTA